jgi:deazaflavin-dependent oxidoreductase (nitroreductase family)
MDLRRSLQKLFTRTHAALYRASSGRIGGRMGKAEQLLLITTGRKSGQPRTTPLVVIPDGERFLFVASNGGAPRHPDWYFNLTANPEVVIQRGAQRLALRARTATPAERAELWPAVIAVYAGYDNYQKKTEREIPLVICDPAG